MTMQEILTDAFADLNAQMLSRQLAWAQARLEDTKAVIADLAPKRRQMGEWAYYDAVFAAAGGKTWKEMIFGDLVGNVTKNINNTIAKRDAKIIDALTKAGITELEPFTLTHIGDGFEGYFRVDGNRIIIKTILAGGYNIQCLHQRTTVKIN